MGCCCSKKEEAEVHASEAPVRQKKKHDLIWFLFLILACAGSIYITMRAKTNPNFAPIYQNGVDSWGNICGLKEYKTVYGHIKNWKGGITKDEPVGYPVHQLDTVDSPSQYAALDRSKNTKMYNSGFPAHGTVLCMEKCPGEGLNIYKKQEDLQNIVAIYLASQEEDFTEALFESAITKAFADRHTMEAFKNSLWCKTVAAKNGYTDLGLCDSQKVMMPSSTILHMCTPHYKIALAVGKSVVDQQATANNRTDVISKSTWSDQVIEAGNAVVANKKNILLCFIGAAILALAVILIIQIMTKYLIYTIVAGFFLLSVGAIAVVWYKYLQIANPAFLEKNGIPSNLDSSLCKEEAASRMLYTDPYASMESIEQGISEYGAVARMCLGKTNGTSSQEQLKKMEKTWLYIAGGVTFICLTIIMLICCNCGNIRLAVTLFDEAGVCVFAMPGIFMQPVYTLVILLVSLAACLSQFIFVKQIFVPVVYPDDHDRSGQVVWLEKSSFWQYIWLFTLFVTFWIWYFIDGCHQVVMAGAVNNWYWTQGNETLASKCLARFRCCPGAKAFCDLFWYSLGSVAFGSMLIAIVSTIKVIIALIQHMGRKAAGGKETKLTKMLFACIQCLLACVQKFLEFINRNAYIGIAMFGYNFCRSAQKCLALKMENAGRAITLMMICRGVLFLGKLCSVAASMFLLNYLLGRDPVASDMPMHSAVAVYGCVGLFSFFITSVFLGVYDLTLDTIFMCFCEDQNRNNGRDRPYKSSAQLQKFMRENA